MWFLIVVVVVVSFKGNIWKTSPRQKRQEGMMLMGGKGSDPLQDEVNEALRGAKRYGSFSWAEGRESERGQTVLWKKILFCFEKKTGLCRWRRMCRRKRVSELIVFLVFFYSFVWVPFDLFRFFSRLLWVMELFLKKKIENWGQFFIIPTLIFFSYESMIERIHVWSSSMPNYEKKKSLDSTLLDVYETLRNCLFWAMF